MIVHQINDLSNLYVIDLLKDGLKHIPEDHLLENYHPDNQHAPANLFYILENGRFKIGNYFVMEENGEYVGSAGWNQYEDIALVLTRAFVPPAHRQKYNMAKYLLPIMFDQTQEYHRLWITCNDYNYVIYQALIRLQQGKSAGLFAPWPEIYKNFTPIGKRIVNYTEQYVAEYLK